MKKQIMKKQILSRAFIMIISLIFSGFTSFAQASDKFEIVKFEQLDDKYLAIKETTNGASCCTYIHIFNTKPKLKEIYTHNSDVIEFSSKNVIIRYEDKKGIDLSKYPLCCRPQDKVLINIEDILEND